jgi:SAM-dependent methyltransferase
MSTQQSIDERNAAFWDELCGTSLARSIAVTDHTPASLRRFDEAYFDLYPYLPAQLRASRRPSEPLLEIGLGFGTVSQYLAEAGCDYHGCDIARAPVEIVRERLRTLKIPGPEDRVVQGSALAIPHPDKRFEHVVSIGCLHHTGDLPRAVSEAHRVLRPGGTALVMLYNRHSFRQLQRRFRTLGGGDGTHHEAEAYDFNVAGDAAPETVFVTARQVRQELFSSFSEVRIERHNFDPVILTYLRGRPVGPTRNQTLATIARVLGLDLYIHARR